MRNTLRIGTAASIATLLLTATLSWAQTRVATAAAGPAVIPDAAPVVVATVDVTDQGYVVRPDDGQIARTYPKFLSQQPPPPPGARVSTLRKEDYAARIQSEAVTKLNQLFPNGIPPQARSKVKITVTVKFSKPPEVGISVSW